MSENSSEDRTEQPTARRLKKAREEGQFARSIELPAAAIVIGSFLALLMMGSWMTNRLMALFAQGFVFDRKTLDRPQLMISAFSSQFSEAFVVVLPLILLTLVLAIIASGLTGGYHFSVKAILPKAEKLNPINGLQRMFGPKALIELGKAVLKCVLVASVLSWSVMLNMDALIRIGRMGIEPAMEAAGAMIAESALWVSLSLAVIAMIDVPYQKHEYIKRLKMTKQEVKDEFKEMEGRPEVKAKIRQRQRQMANARMIQRVKDADVVITNPEHFAVALEYDPTGDGAPILVAKGADLMAQKIREEAAQHGIRLFEAAPLARALYFTTDAEQAIPEALYHAVAQVIAYVFSLEADPFSRSTLRKPDPIVPDAMQFNADGTKTSPQEANA